MEFFLHSDISNYQLTALFEFAVGISQNFMFSAFPANLAWWQDEKMSLGHSFETSRLLISGGKCFRQMSRTALQRGQVITHNYESWPVQGTGTIVLYPISSGLTSQFTLWESDNRWVNAWLLRCICVCAPVCICVCARLCVSRPHAMGGGEFNLSHRGAATVRKMRCGPRISLAVSMNEMTGLKGY